MTRIRSGVIRAFYIGFSALFLSLFACAIFNFPATGCNPLMVLLLSALWLMLLLLAAGALTRLAQGKPRLLRRIVVCVLCCMAAVMFAFGRILETRPIFDFGALHYGAVAWAQTGSLGGYEAYFCKFPNNIGGVLFLKNLYAAAAAAGCRDYYLIGTLANILLIVGSAALTIAIARRLAGDQGALTVLLIWAGMLPLYFYAPIFYSDTLSMLFPLLAYLFYLRAAEAASLPGRLAWMAGAGAACAVGMTIKFTVLIALIAIALEILFNGPVKRMLPPLLCASAVCALAVASIHAYVYATVLDQEKVVRKSTPYAHWVMMGLKGVGAYNPEDYAFTDAIEDPDERRKADEQMIMKRLRAYGPAGLMAHLGRKSAYLVSSGTYGAEDFLDDNPVYHTVLHEFGLQSGAGFPALSHAAQGLHALLLLLAALSAVRARRGTPLAPRMAFFGLFLFLLMWEADPRYLLHFWPFLVLSGVMGLAEVKSLLIACSKRSRGPTGGCAMKGERDGGKTDDPFRTGGCAGELVSASQPSPAVEGTAHALSRVGIRNHAAADAYRSGAALL